MPAVRTGAEDEAGAVRMRTGGAPWRGAGVLRGARPGRFEAVRTLRRVGGWPRNRPAPFNRTLKGTPQ